MLQPHMEILLSAQRRLWPKLVEIPRHFVLYRQRAESKDYIDLLAIMHGGMTLTQAMAAARALYREQYNPLLTVKSLTYFEDGDLSKLSGEQRTQLLNIAASQSFDLPEVKRISDHLSPAAQSD